MALLFDGALFQGSRQAISFTVSRPANTRIFITVFDAPGNTVRLLLLFDHVRAANLSEPSRGYRLQTHEVRRQADSFALSFATQTGDLFVMTPLFDWPRVKVNDNI